MPSACKKGSNVFYQALILILPSHSINFFSLQGKRKKHALPSMDEWACIPNLPNPLFLFG